MRYTISLWALNGTLQSGLRSGTLDTGEDWQADGLDGTVHETAHHRVRGAPRVQLITRNVSNLSLLNASPDIPVAQLDGTAGLDLWCVRGASNAPSYASGTVHRRFRMARGAIFMRRVSWSAGQKAELELEALGFSSDGITNPIAESDLALPVFPTTDQGWVLTDLTIDGNSIPRVQTLEITVDPKAQHDFAYGLPYPTALIFAGVNGYIEWRMRAVAGGHANIPGGTGAVAATFTRLAHGGGMGTNTVTFVFNAEFSVREQLSGTAGEPVQTTFIVRPRALSGVVPVNWTVA